MKMEEPGMFLFALTYRAYLFEAQNVYTHTRTHTNTHTHTYTHTLTETRSRAHTHTHRYDKLSLGYTETQGSLALREAIVSQYHGSTVTLHDVIVCAPQEGAKVRTYVHSYL